MIPIQTRDDFKPDSRAMRVIFAPNCASETCKFKHALLCLCSHGGHKVFSWKGIETCVQFFQQKGNPVYVVVPQWRKSCHPAPAKEQNMRIIASLEQQGLMAWTPSRQIGLRMTSSYDDPFILKYAEKTNGVVVSNDYFRDVLQKCPQFREIIEERTLMYTFFENA